MNWNKIHRNILFMLIMALPLIGMGQNVRYLQRGSTHALSVPENPDYDFHWSGYYLITTNEMTFRSTTNVTNNIEWSRTGTYYITVYPEDKTTHCLGEPIYLNVIVVDYMSLHAFDDTYFTLQNRSVGGELQENDFDERQSPMYYTNTPVISPKNGTVEILADGSFTYTPNLDFVGVDSFMYEVCVLKSNGQPEMCANAMARIVVGPTGGEADITMEKTGPRKALYGDDIEYTLVIRNNGPDQAINVIVRDSLPFGIMPNDYTYSLNNRNPQPWTGEIAIGNLAVGDSAVVVIMATISQFSPSNIWNQALAYSDNLDPLELNNDSIWHTEVSNIYVDAEKDILVPSCETAILHGEGSNSINPVVGYNWAPSTYLSDPNIANPLFTPSGSIMGDSIKYVLTITDANGYSASDTITVTVPEPPTLNIADTLYVDKGDTLILDASQSTGVDLKYRWTSDDGTILAGATTDSLTIADRGVYYLSITDKWNCKQTDSIVVLYYSYPPVTLFDSISVVAGTTDSINVLQNDFDRNGFDLSVSQIVTPFSSYTLKATFTPDGMFYITPQSELQYGFWDSLQYQVCNNGIPQQCSTEWLHVYVKRPPLNADVSVTKSTNTINFWGDSIVYDFAIMSAGPDTATVVRLTDAVDRFLIDPVYSYSTDNGNSWSTWLEWGGSCEFRNVNLLPNQTVFRVKLRAWVHPNAEQYIQNKAWIDHNLARENNYLNDTASFVTKIKTEVKAVAGEDIFFGGCQSGVQFDASESTGDEITYQWSPSLYLDDPTSPTPNFTPGQTITYVLTITDDDGLQDSDTLTVFVLQPPVADAGEDIYIGFDEDGQNEPGLLDGSGSSGADLTYLWTTENGRFFGSEVTDSTAIVDGLGEYQLKVTDIAGCTDSSTVNVWRFYFPPVATPDYYSTTANGTVTGNVLLNDADVNDEGFVYTTREETITTNLGGTVTINNDGTFTYKAPNKAPEVDYFHYYVCNNATPAHCGSGLVVITLAMGSTQKADMTIEKLVDDDIHDIGETITYTLKVRNNGPTSITSPRIFDELPTVLSNPTYTVNTSTVKQSWPSNGIYTYGGRLDSGDSLLIYISGTLTADAYRKVFNGAAVASTTFDSESAWGEDIVPCNTDTVSFFVNEGLAARAILYENYTVNNIGLNDGNIASCLKTGTGADGKPMHAYLDASESLDGGFGLGISKYVWSPAYLLDDPNAVQPNIIPDGITWGEITFTLMIEAEVDGTVRRAYDRVVVNIERAPLADLGPDKKLNPGIPLLIDATNSYYGDGGWYQWDIIDGAALTDTSDPMQKYATSSGIYMLTVMDKYQCSDVDSVVITENGLVVVDDVVLIVGSRTFYGNVASNDYDPDGDSITYTSWSTPLNGILQNTTQQGNFEYTPKIGFTGQDYFEYTVCDDNDPALCRTGRVYVDVLVPDSVNNKPVANHDEYFMLRGDTLLANVLLNDFDYDGGILTADTKLISMPTQGKATLRSDGTLEYIPYSTTTSDYERFVYQVCDNGIPSECDTASVTIQFLKFPDMNHAPVASDDAYYLVDTDIRGNVMDNDFDPDGDTIKVDPALVTEAKYGSFVLYADGSFIYHPNADFVGTDQVVYRIYDDRIDRLYDYATVVIVSFEEEDLYSDVSLSKTAPATILSGSEIEYTLTAKVGGPSLANDIVISDPMVEFLTNKSYSLDQGETWISWNGNIDSLQVLLYGEFSVLLRGTVPDVFNDTIVNHASVDHSMTEMDPVNNSDSVQTIVYQRVIAVIPSDTLVGACDGFMLDATRSLGMDSTSMTYQWSPAENLDNPYTATPTVRDMVPGSSNLYTLIVSCSYDGFVDSDTATVILRVGSEVIANAGPDQFPETNGSVILDGGQSIGAGPLTYTWWQYDIENNVVVIDSTVSISVSRTGKYYLSVRDSLGCEVTDDVYVLYPVDEFVAVDDVIETWQEEPVSVNVLLNDIIDIDDEYNLGSLYVVTPPQDGSVTILDSTITYTPNPYFSGTDSFCYIVSTVYQPQSMACVYVTVKERLPEVPKGFSPNGDGINDYLVIDYIDIYPGSKLIVFNRWGGLVYEKENYSNNEPWDGVATKGIRIGKGILPAGGYLYILDLGENRYLNERYIKGVIYIASGK